MNHRNVNDATKPTEPTAPGASPIPRVERISARVLAVVSGLLYLLAFVPPRRLRRMCAQGASVALIDRSGVVLTETAARPPSSGWA